MTFSEIMKNQDQEPRLDSLEQKIDFNRNLLRKELDTLGQGNFTFSIAVDELISSIRNTQEAHSFLDFIKFKDKNYSLHVRKNVNEQNNNGYKLDIFNKEENFNTFRSENPHIAGWVGQGGFTFEINDSRYHSEDHWGVSVAEELKGSGLADILYDLKCQVDNQLEFEHVSGDNLQFLTFYIKKGYIPYSLIKLNPVREEIINKDKLNEIILEIKESRKDKSQLRDTDYAFRLKLDPIEAMKIYSDLKG